MSFKISCLLFIRDSRERILLIKRKKSPNLGFWSPPGGKLAMADGESPSECAIREAHEETGLVLKPEDLSLFGYVSERDYEGNGHWLMFLYDCHKNMDVLPNSFEEGHFAFFDRDQINNLSIPPSDHKLIWPYYDRRDQGFWGLQAEWVDGIAKIKIEANPN